MGTENIPKTPWWRDGLIFFARVSGWVIIPIIIALFVGKWLDKQFGTDPWIFFVATGLSFIISLFGLIKESSKYMRSVSKPKQEQSTHNDGTRTTNTTNK